MTPPSGVAPPGSQRRDHHARGNTEEATGTPIVPQINTDYLDRVAINYPDHSQRRAVTSLMSRENLGV